MALTNAERQRRYRERRAAGVPVQPAPRPPRPNALGLELPRGFGRD